MYRFLLQKTFDPDKQRGLVDAFLWLQYKNGDQHLTNEQVMGLILDAIGGGMFVWVFTSIFCFLSFICVFFAKSFL